MKQICNVIFASLLVGFLFGQDTLLYTDFQDGTLAGWTSIDNDGLSQIEDFEQLGMGFSSTPVLSSNDFRAIAVSAFTNGSTADNWLISPLIQINESGTSLSWEANSLSADPDALEAYKVMVSNSDNTINAFDTQLLRINTEDGTTRRTVDLSAYLGQSIYLAFNHFTTDGYALAIDNILIEVPSSPLSAELTTFLGDRYQDANAINLSLELRNTGTELINSVSIAGTINGIDGEFLFSNLNVAPGQTEPLDFTSLFPFAVDRYDLVGQITELNGTAFEGNPNSATFYIVADPPTKKLLIEEATGTSCAWCPAGIVSKELMKIKYRNDIIAVSVHNEDPMTNVVYDLGLRNLIGFGGFPSAVMNRDAFVEVENMEQYFVDSFDNIAPLSLDLQQVFDRDNRRINLKLTALAHTTIGGANHRFGFILKEDNVTGTDIGYSQANNYSFEALNLPLNSLDGKNWQELPDPVPASQMVYNDVARDIIGGFDGILESMPTLLLGDEGSFEIDYNLPTTFDEEEMWVIGFVIDAETGAIVNAIEEKLDLSSSVEDLNQSARVELFPNPSSSDVFISFELNKQTSFRLSLVDPLGRVLYNYSGSSNAGFNQFEIQRPEGSIGLHYCILEYGGQKVVKKLVFQ